MVAIKSGVKKIFNPSEEPKEMLIATFAIRKILFTKLMSYIRDSNFNVAPQHCLIVGQRGMGKTTLMLRLKYEVEDDLNLSKIIIPIKLSEEQYHISSLPDLWEEVGKNLEIFDQKYKGILEKILSKENESDCERSMFNELLLPFKKDGKRILLFIDNIGDFFGKLSDIEAKRLREILMTCAQIQIIGASTHMIEHSYKYDKPFFEFFYQRILEPINKLEAQNLMVVLADYFGTKKEIQNIIEKTPQRIEVLRRISGGVPRTMILLFEIFKDEDKGSIYEYLESLVDRVGDLYKTRMDQLKPQQQKIIDALARAWEPISAGEVLEKSKLKREGLASNQISAQLKQLEQSQLVEMVGSGRKSYFIRERFFNIWYLMRNGRNQNKEKVLWLTKFLESWCTIDEISAMSSHHLLAMDDEKFSSHAAYYKTIALSEIKSIDANLRKQLLNEAEVTLEKKGKKEWSENIHTFNNLLEEPTSLYGEDYKSKVKKAIEENNLDTAEKILLDFSLEQNVNLELADFYKNMKVDYHKAEKYYLLEAEKENTEAMLEIAYLNMVELNNPEQGEKFYLMAIDKGNESAIFSLAFYYTLIEKREEAEKYYLMAIDKRNIKAIFYYSLLLLGQNRTLDALKYIELLFNNEEFFEIDLPIQRHVLIIELIKRHQTQFLVNYFKKEDSLLNKYIRPMYYVLAYFMRDVLLGEYEKATPEIKQTVDEIINKIKIESH